MHIATFVRSLVVLRTLFTVQPQSAWRLTELQTAMRAGFATVADIYKMYIRVLRTTCFVQPESICINITCYTLIH